MLARIANWLRNALRLRRTNLNGDADLDAEIRSYADHVADEKARDGMSASEARRTARAELGGIAHASLAASESIREARPGAWLDSFAQDVRYAARLLRKSPGFTIVAVLTLALGIGANGAIFSVVNSVLLHPLAYYDPDRLVTILHYGTGPIAAGNYLDYRDQSASYETMGAAEFWTPNLTGVGSPEHIFALHVTQNTFPMLGIPPLLGRLFAAGEDHAGSDREAILGYGLWQRRFSGDASVLGKTIQLDGRAYVIIGVMPPDFHFAPFWATHAELWAPLSLEARAQDRGGNSLRLFARLKPGVTLAQARSEMATITARLEESYPSTNTDVVVLPLKEKVVGNVQTPLLILLGAVGFVLLIACANVAHMLLARATARQKEIAVRAALGARRSRVIRQILTECLLLAGIGGSFGLLLAFWGTQALVALSPADIPRVESVAIDTKVVVFLLAVTAATSIAFGLFPALQASDVNLAGALKEGGRGTSEGAQRNRLRSFLVASEFALALTLLIGAGLLIRSFVALQSVDPGFNPHGVLSMIVPVAGSKEAEPGPRAVFYRQMMERVGALPGVESAAGINHLPLAGDMWDRTFLIEGRPMPDMNATPWAVYRIATPGYFRTMGIQFLQGRDLATSDDANSPPVVVINERLAQEYWPNKSPVGDRIALASDPSRRWMTIVGVVKNAKQEDWAAKPLEEMYLDAYQTPDFIGSAASSSAYITLVVRTAADPSEFTSAVKSAIWSLDPNLPISKVLTMDDAVAQANAQPRFEMLLLGIFAAVALVLAAVGIYGVMSYSVARRTHEIGIRISLGARPGDVLRLVVRQGLVLALIGSLAGVFCSLLLARLMTKLLYGVAPYDPVTFAAVTLLLLLVAVVACCVPARRATRVDPVIALRCE
jgi:predicted permease